jgi:hypothetical protein
MIDSIDIACYFPLISERDNLCCRNSTCAVGTLMSGCRFFSTTRAGFPAEVEPDRAYSDPVVKMAIRMNALERSANNQSIHHVILWTNDSFDQSSQDLDPFEESCFRDSLVRKT